MAAAQAAGSAEGSCANLVRLSPEQVALEWLSVRCYWLNIKYLLLSDVYNLYKHCVNQWNQPAHWCASATGKERDGSHLAFSHRGTSGPAPPRGRADMENVTYKYSALVAAGSYVILGICLTFFLFCS